MICIKNGRIFDAVNAEPYVGDILVENGKIKAMGEVTVPADCEVIDAEGMNVYPGFIDAHTHIGLDGYGIGFEGRDYNEMNDICCPQLRAIDGINPMDPTLKMARDAGVTTVCTGPGSANVLGGTFTAIKTVGRRVDDMILKAEVAMKCAFGENPKRCYQS
ncbi:MAG: amidohydrolase, partial [Clostridia bacterium]|nr:amidohydrolase [Clostridia bacterium]